MVPVPRVFIVDVIPVLGAVTVRVQGYAAVRVGNRRASVGSGAGPVGILSWIGPLVVLVVVAPMCIGGTWIKADPFGFRAVVMHMVFIAGNIAALAVFMFGAPSANVTVSPKIVGSGLKCEHAKATF